MAESESNSAGGFGGNVFDRPSVRAAELKLVRRAIRNGWNVPEELKKRIIERVGLIVENEADDDLFLKAARIAIDADKTDLAFEKNEKDAQPSSSGVQVTVNLVEQVVVKPSEQQPTIVEHLVDKPNGHNHKDDPPLSKAESLPAE